jgi:hypothetical protein
VGDGKGKTFHGQREESCNNGPTRGGDLLEADQFSYFFLIATLSYNLIRTNKQIGSNGKKRRKKKTGGVVFNFIFQTIQSFPI